MNTKSIGIFDSGVGGTSIWKEIYSLLPYENTIYLADSKHAPYGNRSKEKILELCIKNTEWLLERSCKLIVIACNTATTNVIKKLRETYTIPFIGIEPAIKPAVLKTETKVVGVLATKGTLTSELFHKTSNLFAKNISVVEQIGEGIVPLIEGGKINSSKMKTLLKHYIKPLLKADIDYLVLGCTHYSYLIPLLIDMLPKHINIIDSGEAVAKQTKAVLKQSNLLNSEKENSKNLFYTNGNPKIMSSLLDNKFDITYLDF